jgi:hypothetical protein
MNKNIIESQFFKYLFFDKYMGEIGSNPVEVCKNFKIFLEFFDLYKDSVFYIQFNRDFETIMSETSNVKIETLKRNKKFYLISGYNNLTMGHTIGLYFDYKESSNTFDIYVINSGEGVNIHSNSDNGKYAVIIKYSNIEESKVKNVLLLNKFLWNNDRKTLISAAMNKGEFKETLWNMETNGYFNYELYKSNEQIVNSRLFYLFLNDILIVKPEHYKWDYPQVSASCSFFSTYFYLKYLLFDTPENFILFIDNIKKTLLNLMPTLTREILASDDVIEHHSVINVCNLLIKDYDFDKKLELTEIIKSVYNSYTFSSSYKKIDKIIKKDPRDRSETRRKNKIKKKSNILTNILNKLDDTTFSPIDFINLVNILTEPRLDSLILHIIKKCLIKITEKCHLFQKYNLEAYTELKIWEDYDENIFVDNEDKASDPDAISDPLVFNKTCLKKISELSLNNIKQITHIIYINYVLTILDENEMPFIEEGITDENFKTYLNTKSYKLLNSPLLFNLNFMNLKKLMLKYRQLFSKSINLFQITFKNFFDETERYSYNYEHDNYDNIFVYFVDYELYKDASLIEQYNKYLIVQSKKVLKKTFEIADSLYNSTQILNENCNLSDHALIFSISRVVEPHIYLEYLDTSELTSNLSLFDDKSQTSYIKLTSNYCDVIYKPIVEIFNIESFFDNLQTNENFFYHNFLLLLTYLKKDELCEYFEKKIVEGLEKEEIKNNFFMFLYIFFKNKDFNELKKIIYINQYLIEFFLNLSIILNLERELLGLYLINERVYDSKDFEELFKDDETPKELDIINTPPFNQLINQNIFKREELYYYFYKKSINIVSEDGKLFRNEKKEVLISPEKLSLFINSLDARYNNKKTTITKILYCYACNIWYNEIDKIISIDILKSDYESIINLEGKSFLIKNKVEIFEIIEDYSFVEGLYLTFLNNGFLIKYDNKISLLLFLTDIFLKSQNFNAYFNNYKSNIELKMKEYIFEFSYNNLFFNNSNLNDYQALFYSLVRADNNIGLTLILNKMINLIDDKQKFLSETNIDSSYWFMFFKSNIPFHTRKINLEEIDPRIDYDLSTLKDLQEYKLVKKLSDTINLLKDDTIKSRTKEELHSYLDKVRTACVVFTKENARILSSKNAIDEYLETNTTNITVHKTSSKNKIFESFINGGDVTKIKFLQHIYIENYIELYKLIILLNYNKIYNSLNKLEDDDYSCGNILKIIELIDDNYIQNFDKKRTVDELLFELNSGLFLRESQVELLNKFNVDIETNINDKTYEILMGQGKTSTLTPMIILKYIYNQKFNKFNIILPSHLVEQSFDIINRYSNIFSFAINVGKNYLEYDKEQQVNIIDCASFKNFILDNINENIVLEEDDEKLFIFDEIDSLLNPLKSDLNKPTAEIIPHFNKDTVQNLAIKLNKILLGIDEVSYKTSDNVQIKYNGKIIYSYYIEDCSLSTIISDKINKTLKTMDKLIFSKDYGFGSFSYMNGFDNIIKLNKKHFTAIPYAAINQPLEESQFSDYELLMFLTINSYYKNKLRDTDILLLLSYLEKLIKENEKLIEILPIKFNLQKAEFINMIYYKSEAICRELVQKYQNNYEIIDYYIKEVIVPHFFEIHKDQSNISTIDLFNRKIAKNKITFSGTVNFYKPGTILKEYVKNNDNIIFNDIEKSLITKIESDSFASGSIKSSIYGTLTVIPKTIVYKNNSNYEIQKNLLKYFTENIANYDALIDQGGLILFSKTIDIVKMIHELKKDKKILYVDENNQRMIYHEDGSKTKYNGDLIKNVFIFYDHKNCVGTDFKQPNKMHGLITMRTDDNLTNMSQAIFRLRNINIGHTIDFFYPEDIVKNHIDPLNSSGLLDFIKDDIYYEITDKDIEKYGECTNTEIIYTYLNDSEDKYKLSTLSKLRLQLSKYVLRFMKTDKSSYFEKLFYDLEPLEDKKTYILKKKFIKKYLEYINTILSTFDLKINLFDFDSEEIKIERSIERNVERGIDRREEKNVKINLEIQDYGSLLSDIEFEKCEDNWKKDHMDVISGEYFISYKGMEMDELSTILDYKVKFSPILFNELYQIKTTGRRNYNILFSKVYIVKDKEIFICTLYEYGLIHSKPDEYVKIKDLPIIGYFGENIKNINKLRDIDVLVEIFTTKKNSFVDIFNTLSKIYKKDDKILTKMIFYNKFLNLDKKYVLTDITFNDESYLDKKLWSKVFKINEDDFIRLIQKEYIAKYVPGYVDDGTLRKYFTQPKYKIISLKNILNQKLNPNKKISINNYKNDSFKDKYLKYKTKYLKLKQKIDKIKK